MAGGDRRGPAGFGPMTGRGAGFCSGNDRPGYAAGYGDRGGFGRGGGFRSGGGRGFRNRYAAPPVYGQGYGPQYGPQYGYPEFTPQQEVEMLKSNARYLDEEIKAVNERINELENLSTPKE